MTKFGEKCFGPATADFGHQDRIKICEFNFRRQFSKKTTDEDGTEKSVLQSKVDNETDLIQFNIYDYYEAYNFLTGNSMSETSNIGKV
jgi:hypothetical protein